MRSAALDIWAVRCTPSVVAGIRDCIPFVDGNDPMLPPRVGPIAHRDDPLHEHAQWLRQLTRALPEDATREQIRASGTVRVDLLQYLGC